MDAVGAAKGISGKALLVVLVLVGGAVGLYARQAMAGPSNYAECLLDELRGQPEQSVPFAKLVCGSRFPNWKAEVNAMNKVANPS